MKNKKNRWWTFDYAWVFHAEPQVQCDTTLVRYRCVCKVNSYDLFEVLDMTHVHEYDESLDWTDNRDVFVWTKPNRATSIGDIIVTPDSGAWFVEEDGFLTIDLGPVQSGTFSHARTWLLHVKLIMELIIYEWLFKAYQEQPLYVQVSIPTEEARLSDA